MLLGRDPHQLDDLPVICPYSPLVKSKSWFRRLAELHQESALPSGWIALSSLTSSGNALPALPTRHVFIPAAIHRSLHRREKSGTVFVTTTTVATFIVAAFPESVKPTTVSQADKRT
jgi:hypothetical protein